MRKCLPSPLKCLAKYLPFSFPLASWLLSLAISCPVASAVDVIAVCPENFRQALSPWLDHRREQGLVVKVIGSESDDQTLRSSIRRASDAETRYIVLIGDAPPIGVPCNSLRQVPIHYQPTVVTQRWGSTPTLSTDSSYGNLDQDQIPDAVVGRLPVDDSKQLQKLVARIIARDESQDFGHWRGRVQLVGGVGGFGMLADRAIESVTRTVVTGVLPAATRTSVVYASPGHPFYPSQPFTESVLTNYRTGSRFWVYAGHGQVTELDRVPPTAAGTPVLDPRSVLKLQRPAAESPIAVLLACYTGAIDAPEDSIAEQMILSDGGPIAVLAGSRVTMPYGNAMAAIGLIDAIYQQQLPRLGDAWHSAMVKMHQETTEEASPTRMMIDGLATLISPAGTKLVDERREHMALYNLIGDPTLRLHHPLPVVITIKPGYDAGKVIQLELTSPIAGEVRVELDRPLGAVTGGNPNDTSVATWNMRVAAKQAIKPTFVLPTDVSGALVVRVFIKGKEAWATGAAKTFVREPSPANPSS